MIDDGHRHLAHELTKAQDRLRSLEAQIAAMGESDDDIVAAADALAHAVRDAVTHDFSAGAVIHMQNARKTYEARRRSRRSRTK